MTNYARRELPRFDPCGVAGLPETHCRYLRDCTAWSQTVQGYLCLSKMGWEVAKYLLDGSTPAQERKDLGEFVKSGVGKMMFVDPQSDRWKPQQITAKNSADLVTTTIQRGEDYTQRAQARGGRKDPLDFHCKPEDIIRDLL